MKKSYTIKILEFMLYPEMQGFTQKKNIVLKI